MPKTKKTKAIKKTSKKKSVTSKKVKITVKSFSQKEKVQRFLEALSVLQPANGKDIGVIVLNKETLSDVTSCFPNSNLVTAYDLKNDSGITKTIEQLAETLKEGRIAVIRLYQYLDPKLYNQLYLVAKAGRMDIFKMEGSIVINVPKQAQIVIVTTDQDLEALNYKNLFSVTGPVLRL